MCIRDSPKADLEQLLRDYAMYKRISQDLKDEYIGAQIFFREVVPTGLPKPPANYNYAADRLELAYRRVVSSFAAKNITPKTFNRLIAVSYTHL